VDRHQIIQISPGPFHPFEKVGDPYSLSEVKLLAPVLPSKIISVGLNYPDHIKEMQHPFPSEPIIFLKPSTAVIGPEQTILYPKMAGQVDFEAELAVVIKERAKNIEPKDAEKFILGYSCFNDVTARDLQKKDGQWSRAKGFDTFAPIGPWIVTDLDFEHAQIESYLNGELKQSGNPKSMIFKIPQLISFASKIMTLEPGDVISTGTPPGVGPMHPGDVIDIRIEGIGVLRNMVAA